MKPQTIQIFLPEGSPTSVKEAELTNRLIKIIWFSRSAMDKVSKGSEYLIFNLLLKMVGMATPYGLIIDRYKSFKEFPVDFESYS